MLFRPTNEPARTFYDAFHAAAKQQPRDFASEERAVHDAAVAYAERHGLRVPTLDEIREAQVQGMGHVDYGAKWAYAVCRLLGVPG